MNLVPWAWSLAWLSPKSRTREATRPRPRIGHKPQPGGEGSSWLAVVPGIPCSDHRAEASHGPEAGSESPTAGREAGPGAEVWVRPP